jgi:hypothetical protein
MNITNSISAETAMRMAEASDKDLMVKMEKFFNEIRAAAEGGETEIPIPNLLQYPYRGQVGTIMRGLGYRVGYHPLSRNQIVVSWATEPPKGWRDDEALPF